MWRLGNVGYCSHCDALHVGWNSPCVSILSGLLHCQLFIFPAGFLILKISLQFSLYTKCILLYFQIMVLGMTTNERMNAGRYKHFEHGNPFHRGALQNIADFCNVSFCGIKAKPSSDWLHSFDIKSVEKLPLLTAKDNYQYVWNVV